MKDFFFLFFFTFSVVLFSQDVKYKQIPQKNIFLLIIDKSGSMSGSAMSDAKTGAKYFISQLKKDDKAGLISFSNSISEEVPITSNRSSLRAGISGLSPGGGTQLYDALASGVKTLISSSGTRIIVYLTDGYDTGSNFSLSNVGSMFLVENIFL